MILPRTSRAGRSPSSAFTTISHGNIAVLFHEGRLAAVGAFARDGAQVDVAPWFKELKGETK